MNYVANNPLLHTIDTNTSDIDQHETSLSFIHNSIELKKNHPSH